MYVGDIAGSAKNTRTTIYGMTAQYWKSVVVGFENRGLTLPQRKAARCIVLWVGIDWRKYDMGLFDLAVLTPLRPARRAFALRLLQPFACGLRSLR